MKQQLAEVIGEFGPYPEIEGVHGVSYDGHEVWIATGEKLTALNADTGEVTRSIKVAARAGTAFDGRHIFQIAGEVIQKVDPVTGEVVSTIPAPHPENNSGLAWSDGALWVGEYREGKIHKLDPQTGAVLRTIDSNRYVTGVTWVKDELWHGGWDEESDTCSLRHVLPESGEVMESLDLPAGVFVSGLESNGSDRFFCGGGTSGKLRVVRKPSAQAPR